MDHLHEIHLARILEARRRRGVLGVYCEESAAATPQVDESVQTAQEVSPVAYAPSREGQTSPQLATTQSDRAKVGGLPRTETPAAAELPSRRDEVEPASKDAAFTTPPSRSSHQPVPCGHESYTTDTAAGTPSRDWIPEQIGGIHREAVPQAPGTSLFSLPSSDLSPIVAPLAYGDRQGRVPKVQYSPFKTARSRSLIDSERPRLSSSLPRPQSTFERSGAAVRQAGSSSRLGFSSPSRHPTMSTYASRAPDSYNSLPTSSPWRGDWRLNRTSSPILAQSTFPVSPRDVGRAPYSNSFKQYSQPVAQTTAYPIAVPRVERVASPPPRALVAEDRVENPKSDQKIASSAWADGAALRHDAEIGSPQHVDAMNSVVFVPTAASSAVRRTGMSPSRRQSATRQRRSASARRPMRELRQNVSSLPHVHVTTDLQHSVRTLRSGDWFIKWNSSGTAAQDRWVWVDTQSYLLVWSSKETHCTAFAGNIRLEDICQVSPSVHTWRGKDGVLRPYYVLLITSTQRILQLATQRREQCDGWFDALRNVLAFIRRHEITKGALIPD